MEEVYRVISLVEFFIIVIFLIIPPVAYVIHVFTNKASDDDDDDENEDDPDASTKKSVILAVFPLTKVGYPLNLRDDFITFITQLPSLRVIALVDDVAYTRLVSWIKRLVATKEHLHIFYIASHGSKHGIAFTDGVIDAKRLATLMVLAEVDLVILMVCDGFNVAHTMRRHGVKAVVYIDGKIEDKEAIKLMKSLIGGLADGLTLSQALLFTKAEAPNIVAYAKLRETSAHNYKFSLEEENGET